MLTDIGVIWNPTKTDRESLESGLAEALDGAPAPTVKWWQTSADDAGQAVARDAIDAGAQLLVVAGADGTVRAVAERIADDHSTVEMGIVPLGTGNLLARNLGVPLNDVGAAFARALTRQSIDLDVGWVDVELESRKERHAFVVMVGFGIDAQMIAETDDDLKEKAGWLAYVESLGRALDASDVVPFHIVVDDRPGSDEEGHTLLIANCGMLQGGVTLLPDADPSDGELDYLLLSAEGVGEWVGTLKTMVWDNGIKKALKKDAETTSTDSVNHGRARKLEISLPHPRAFEIDGEEIGETNAFSVTIQPRAVRVR